MRCRAGFACQNWMACPPLAAVWSAIRVRNHRRIERFASVDKPDMLGTPDALLMLREEVAVFDNLHGKLYLVVHVDPAQPQAYARGVRRLDELTHRLRHSGRSYPEVLDPSVVNEADFVSGFTKEGFLAAVQRCKEYIRAGDIFQVVLSQRMSIPFRARPVDVYRALRALNPSPYMYFIDLGSTQIVGSSPEILVRLEAGRITLRPIAGTRPRGTTPDEDRALEAELLADPKERAEHLMLIDLGRNDVGRVARTGSVSVPDRFVVERYSHVMHIVSQVEGDLADGLRFGDVLRATFPAAPSMEPPRFARSRSSRNWNPSNAISIPARSAIWAGMAMPTPPSPFAPQ